MGKIRSRTVGWMLACCLPFFSCDKVEEGDYYTKNRELSGKQEVPRVGTSASGNFTVIYTPGSGKVRMNMSWEDLSSPVRRAYIQGPASRGQRGGILVDFTRKIDKVESGTFHTKFFLNGTNQLEKDLLAGLWYINIQTDRHPEGEIRGEIELKLK